jgi:hypothetical protein
MSTFGKALIAGVMIFAPSIGLVAVAEAQLPIRIGTSRCLKHTNQKGSDLVQRAPCET